MIPVTEMRLREAQFFGNLLHNTAQQVVHDKPEVFAFYLHAFLSAARAVTFVLQFEDKTNYDAWFPQWWAETLTEEQRELCTFMVNQRNFAEKRGGAEITGDDELEWIPVAELRSAAHRSNLAYGFQFWAPWRQGAQVGRPVYQFAGFSGDEKKVTSVCKEYVDILDTLVKDFVSWRQASSGGAMCPPFRDVTVSAI